MKEGYVKGDKRSRIDRCSCGLPGARRIRDGLGAWLSNQPGSRWEKIIFLLGGRTKRGQQKDIELAVQVWENDKKRKAKGRKGA